MRFLVVGLGSMGKRRVRNLQHLNAGHIAGFDPRADRRDEARAKYRIETYASLDEAISVHQPDALVISTPPDLHVRYAKIAAGSGRHFFCEASVVDDEMGELMRLVADTPGLVAAPSCTWRYHPAVVTIKELVQAGEIGDPLLFTYHSGQWLPDWHPWEDYRGFYVAKRRTGACREIVPFELVWLTWVFGEVESVQALRGKLSTLDADIDDVYQVLLRFRSGLLGHLLVDVIARRPVRHLRVCSEQGTIEWNAEVGEVRVFRAGDDGWKTIAQQEQAREPGYINPENPYIAEMNDFVRACRGEAEWGYSLVEDYRLLTLLQVIESSAEAPTRVC